MTSARYLCHEQPDLYRFTAQIVERRPDAVLLDRSAFYPGGGGQLSDRGLLRWSTGSVRVTHIEYAHGLAWHRLEASCPVPDVVTAEIDKDFRVLMCQLHTDLHVLNGLVYQRFQGALVTGVQMSPDGTARIDFDLPDADNDRLRALEPEVNSIIDERIDVVEHYWTEDEVRREPGAMRSSAVTPPPQPDGTVRIVEILGLDRQACGGTHLRNTGESSPIRIVKVDNKGCHNRRIRIALRPWPENLGRAPVLHPSEHGASLGLGPVAEHDRQRRERLHVDPEPIHVLAAPPRTPRPVGHVPEGGAVRHDRAAAGVVADEPRALAAAVVARPVLPALGYDVDVQVDARSLRSMSPATTAHRTRITWISSARHCWSSASRRTSAVRGERRRGASRAVKWPIILGPRRPTSLLKGA